MANLQIFRKRLIPAETVLLKDDVVLRQESDRIVTSWRAFHPRPDLMRGFSCYYTEDHLKVSRMIHDDSSFHWYIDIADYTWNASRDVLTMTDLLADVTIGEDGLIRVMDLDELADAHAQGLISNDLLKKSLYTLDRLLRELYAHGIERLAKPLMDFSAKTTS